MPKQAKPVPQVYLRSSQAGFSHAQDTLLFNLRKFSGHVISLYPNGDTAFSGSYLNGLEEGELKKWFANGQVAESRFYVEGKKEGTHKAWWQNGHPQFEYHFADGEYHGALKEWYQNGNPYRFFHYNMGYEEGSEKMWWENGEIRANYVVKTGKKYGLIGMKICGNPYDSILLKK